MNKAGDRVPDPALIEVRDLSVFFGPTKVVESISFDVQKDKVTALIGSSGCGKTTLLRAICRSLDDEPEAVIQGSVRYKGEDIFSTDDVGNLRRRLSYVSQLPNLFKTNVYENVFIPIHYWYPWTGRDEADERVERALRRAGLWAAVRDRLADSAANLSAGEKQKLCLARALAVEPDVLLLDEPTANLDPISIEHFEEVIHELRGSVGILVITHNMQQAARISQRCQHMHFGQLVEVGDTSQIFTNPRAEATRGYITGRFG